MNVGALAARVAAIAFGVLGSDSGVTVQASFVCGGTRGYNPATASATVTGATSFTVTAIQFKSAAKDGAPPSKTQSLLVQSSQVPSGVTILESDTVTIAGLLWTVTDVNSDPANATVTLKIQHG